MIARHGGMGGGAMYGAFASPDGPRACVVTPERTDPGEALPLATLIRGWCAGRSGPYRIHRAAAELLGEGDEGYGKIREALQGAGFVLLADGRFELVRVPVVARRNEAPQLRGTGLDDDTPDEKPRAHKPNNPHALWRRMERHMAEHPCPPGGFSIADLAMALKSEKQHHLDVQTQINAAARQRPLFFRRLGVGFIALVERKAAA